MKADLGRYSIVATKAVSQCLGHGLKLAYFGLLIDSGGTLPAALLVMAVLLAVLGTSLSRRVLEAMSDRQFQTWTQRLIACIGLAYLGQGTWLLVAG